MEDSFNNELNKKIIQYFDHQMSPEDEKEFLHEVQLNPSGHSAFIKELQIREKLKANIYRSSRTNIIGDQIRDRIKKYPGQ